MRRALLPAFLLVGIARMVLRAAPINLERQKAASVASPIPIRVQFSREMVTVPVAAATVSGLPFCDVTAVATKPNPPRTKREAQAVLKHFGFRGLAIESIEAGTQDDEIARVYVLTSPILREDNTMRKRAKTIVITYEDDEIRGRELDGWCVTNPEDE